MPIFQNIRSCVRRKHEVTRKPTKVHFNVRIGDAFKSENVASQLRDLLVYIAREGVAVTDLFRRPGNPRSIKKVIADLEAGRPVCWTNYDFYTLANIAKRFLLHVDGGILGEAAENALIESLDIPDIDARYAAMHTIITSQSKTVQQLLALLFGTWFRMIYHTEVNAMSVEAVAKSVAGSVFPSCTYSPERVEKASKVMEILIVGFAAAELFGRELIEYFTQETKTSISRIEKFKYEFRFPKGVPRPKSTRMFMQMLLEESKKHGFDIVGDEVSREVFESATQPVVTTFPEVDPPYNSSDFDQNVSAASFPTGTFFSNVSNGTSDVQRCSSMRTPLSTLQPTSQNFFLDNNHLTPPHLACPEDAADTRFQRVDRVQQYSEKRTRITATPDAYCRTDNDRQFRCTATASPSHLPTLRSGTAPFSKSPTCNSLSEVDDFSDLDANSQLLTSGGCFNSVKRRQLERLQKRSDWFLSPPAGLRNSGMMRLDPSSPDTPRNAHKMSRSSLGDIGNDAASRDRSTPTTGENLRRKPSRRNMQLTDAAETSQSDAFTAPAALASDRPAGLEPSAANNGHASADGHLSGPAPASWTGGANGVSGGGGHVEDDEDEDNDVLEVRYFIAEKYYGPGPRPPFRKNANSLIDSRPEGSCVNLQP
ncbi:hypothetical protein AAHC03_012869 [Spirometra sp. Aus1]